MASTPLAAFFNRPFKESLVVAMSVMVPLFSMDLTSKIIAKGATRQGRQTALRLFNGQTSTREKHLQCRMGNRAFAEDANFWFDLQDSRRLSARSRTTI